MNRLNPLRLFSYNKFILNEGKSQVKMHPKITNPSALLHGGRVWINLTLQNTPYSIGAPAALFSLITPVSFTKKIRVPVVPLAAGEDVQVNWLLFTMA